jgi:predicted esterase
MPAVPSDFTTTAKLHTSVRVPVERRGAPLVIALHGKGMRAKGFERWLKPGIDAGGASWWVPRGIFPYELENRRIGYAWYVWDGTQEALKASMDEAREYLVGLTEAAVRRLRPSSVTLLGFSQGGYLASYLALSRPDLYQGLVCCCGRPKAEFVADLAAAKDLRVLIQVGEHDRAVSPELMEKGTRPLLDAGLTVDVRTYDAAHKLTAEMARDAAEFVR